MSQLTRESGMIDRSFELTDVNRPVSCVNTFHSFYKYIENVPLFFYCLCGPAHFSGTKLFGSFEITIKWTIFK